MPYMTALEALSYVVTILGLPIAIVVFIIQQRQQRQNEENELHRTLSEEYDNFLKLALDHADLRLIHAPDEISDLTGEEHERKMILYRILISLFEKAYIIVFSDRMSRDTQRMWLSWEDDMREWCERTDFRTALPELLEGEDSGFANRIRAIADEEAARAA
jgi:hypothetical protein